MIVRSPGHAICRTCKCGISKNEWRYVLDGGSSVHHLPCAASAQLSGFRKVLDDFTRAIPDEDVPGLPSSPRVEPRLGQLQEDLAAFPDLRSVRLRGRALERKQLATFASALQGSPTVE